MNGIKSRIEKYFSNLSKVKFLGLIPLNLFRSKDVDKLQENIDVEFQQAMVVLKELRNRNDVIATGMVTLTSELCNAFDIEEPYDLVSLDINDELCAKFINEILAKHSKLMKKQKEETVTSYNQTLSKVDEQNKKVIEKLTKRAEIAEDLVKTLKDENKKREENSKTKTKENCNITADALLKAGKKNDELTEKLNEKITEVIELRSELLERGKVLTKYDLKRMIQMRIDNPKLSYEKIGKKFNVSKHTTMDALKGKTYKKEYKQILEELGKKSVP